MSCKDCYGCLICHNHKVVIKAESKEKKEEVKPADFQVKKTLTGKLVGVRNELKILN